jgi:metal-responsive CopG/Arc/MetJ family transcriptional regulator
MKITVELPDEMGEKIDLEARKDGHTNRNAVIRKALNSFFADELQFSSVSDKENKNQNKGA